MNTTESIRLFISPRGASVSLRALLTDACTAYFSLVIIFSPLRIITQNPSNHRSRVSSHYSISIMFRRIGTRLGETDRSFAGPVESCISASDLTGRRACQFSQRHFETGDRLGNNTGLEVLMCLISL